MRTGAGGGHDRLGRAWGTRALGALAVLAARGVDVPRRLARAVLRRAGTRTAAQQEVAPHRPDGSGTGAPDPSTRAGSGERVISLVAHPDDDLLFLSPDLLISLRTADAVRTVVLTAGDGGRGRLYAWAREEGLRRAYAGACQVPNLWEVRRSSVDGIPVWVNTLCRDRRVSLVFLRLPDGSPDGSGTPRGNGESLQKLLEGTISRLRPWGAESGVTLPELLGLLSQVLADFRPTETRTMNFAGAPGDGDHSDHLACARVTRRAHASSSCEGPLTGYLGYTSTSRPANVPEEWLHTKIATVETYAACDPSFRLGYDPAWVARQYVSARRCGLPLTDTS